MAEAQSRRQPHGPSRAEVGHEAVFPGRMVVKFPEKAFPVRLHFYWGILAKGGSNVARQVKQAVRDGQRSISRKLNGSSSASTVATSGSDVIHGRERRRLARDSPEAHSPSSGSNSPRRSPRMTAKQPTGFDSPCMDTAGGVGCDTTGEKEGRLSRLKSQNLWHVGGRRLPRAS